MVLVNGDHFADEPGMLELLKVFREVAAEGHGMSAGPFIVQETTVFFVSPVSDTEALSKRIHVAKNHSSRREAEQDSSRAAAFPAR